MKAIVSTSKSLASVFFTLFFFGYAIFYLVQWLLPEFLLFLALGALFFYQFFKNASYIKSDEESIRLCFFGLTRKELHWSEVREMGVIGENVFSRKNQKRLWKGERFIYFSTRELNEEGRFQMAVRWPPKDAIYAEYTQELLTQLQTVWNRPVKYYNVEDLCPNTKD